MADATTGYAFRTHLDVPYVEAVEQVTAALKAEGFGVLTQIDVKATLKQKLDADFRPYVILGACNPPLAHKALSTELEIGLLLPCNVIVYADEAGAGAEEGGSVVAIADPLVMLGPVDNPAVEPVAHDARARLQRVIASLGG